jgi:hypothetical protein
MGRRDDGVLRQQRGELDPQGLQQADWQDRHGASTAEMALTSTVAGARACLLLLFSHLPIVGRSKDLVPAKSEDYIEGSVVYMYHKRPSVLKNPF